MKILFSEDSTNQSNSTTENNKNKDNNQDEDSGFKLDNVSQIKPVGSRASIYCVNGNPLFFEEDVMKKQHELWPTVYALLRVPQLLPNIVCRAPVIHFLQKGADLMLPGVLANSPGLILQKDSKQAVILEGTKYDFEN